MLLNTVLMFPPNRVTAAITTMAISAMSSGVLGQVLAGLVAPYGVPKVQQHASSRPYGQFQVLY
jgi:hypothetical protein